MAETIPTKSANKPQASAYRVLIPTEPKYTASI